MCKSRLQVPGDRPAHHPRVMGCGQVTVTGGKANSTRVSKMRGRLPWREVRLWILKAGTGETKEGGAGVGRKWGVCVWGDTHAGSEVCRDFSPS